MPTFNNPRKDNSTIVAIVVSGTLLMGNLKSKADTANIYSLKEETNKTGLLSLYSGSTEEVILSFNISKLKTLKSCVQNLCM